MSEQPATRYWCPYGHEHLSHEDTDECCAKFDLECEWNDPRDPFFLALGGKGDGA